MKAMEEDGNFDLFFFLYKRRLLKAHSFTLVLLYVIRQITGEIPLKEARYHHRVSQDTERHRQRAAEQSRGNQNRGTC